MAKLFNYESITDQTDTDVSVPVNPLSEGEITKFFMDIVSSGSVEVAYSSDEVNSSLSGAGQKSIGALTAIAYDPHDPTNSCIRIKMSKGRAEENFQNIKFELGPYVSKLPKKERVYLANLIFDTMGKKGYLQ